MREVEPNGHNPNHIEYNVDGVGERVHDFSKTVGGSRIEMDGGEQLCKHHVVPEVEEVQQQTEQDDDTQHEHVL